MMLPNVYPILAASAEVTALIGNPPRAYRHGTAPQNVVAPYVTWSVAGGAPENGFDGACADQFRLQFDSWATSDNGVDDLAGAVRAAIEPYAHLVAYVADERDTETQKYRISFAFDWWGLRT